MLVDRAELTSGSTFHSAGLVGQLRGSVTLTRMMMYGAVAVPPARRRDRDGSVLARGGLAAARVRRPSGTRSCAARPAGPRRSGCRSTSSAPDEAQALFPLMSTDGVLGAVYLPTDGWLDPSGLANALAAGARARGVSIQTHTRVVAIPTERGRVTGVTVEHKGERREIRADVVVNAGGIFAPEIGRMAGVTVPLIPMAHQYLFTEPLDGVHAGLPAAARPGQPRLLPRGGRRPVHGRLRARPGALEPRWRPGRLQRQAPGPGHGRASSRSWKAPSAASRRWRTRA